MFVFLCLFRCLRFLHATLLHLVVVVVLVISRVIGHSLGVSADSDGVRESCREDVAVTNGARSATIPVRGRKK